ncbi:hypothetical protein [Bradyrhizobium sp. UFLA05-112]
MKIFLFARDLAGIWQTELYLLAIPGIIVGAGIGYTLRRWFICLIVSAATAFWFLYALNASRPLHPHHQLSLAELAAWSAVATLPVILAATSLGYFAVVWLRYRRAKLKAPA